MCSAQKVLKKLDLNKDFSDSIGKRSGPGVWYHYRMYDRNVSAVVSRSRKLFTANYFIKLYIFLDSLKFVILI